MARQLYTVTVTCRSGAVAVYENATAAMKSHNGDLRIYRGFRKQHVFHPAGEWVEYAVRAE